MAEPSRTIAAWLVSTILEDVSLASLFLRSPLALHILAAPESSFMNAAKLQVLSSF